MKERSKGCMMMHTELRSREGELRPDLLSKLGVEVICGE